MRISETQLRKVISRLINEQAGGPIDWASFPTVTSTWGSERRLSTDAGGMYHFGRPSQFEFPGEGKKFANLKITEDATAAANTFANAVPYFTKIMSYISRRSPGGQEYYKLFRVFPAGEGGFREARALYVVCSVDGKMMNGAGSVYIFFDA